MKRLAARYYKTETGREPVREGLQGPDRDDRKAIGEDVRLVESGRPIGMPVCEAMGDGLFQTGTSLPSGRTRRGRWGALRVLFPKNTAPRITFREGAIWGTDPTRSG
jgi:hypothetical protein